jgi:hypothetical protein
MQIEVFQWHKGLIKHQETFYSLLKNELNLYSAAYLIIHLNFTHTTSESLACVTLWNSENECLQHEKSYYIPFSSNTHF